MILFTCPYKKVISLNQGIHSIFSSIIQGKIDLLCTMPAMNNRIDSHTIAAKSLDSHSREIFSRSSCRTIGIKKSEYITPLKNSSNKLSLMTWCQWDHTRWSGSVMVNINLFQSMWIFRSSVMRIMNVHVSFVFEYSFMSPVNSTIEAISFT